jgi:hypothetical protein
VLFLCLFRAFLLSSVLNSNVIRNGCQRRFFVFVLVPSLSWQSLCLDCAAVERMERGALLLNFTLCFVFERLPQETRFTSRRSGAHVLYINS